MVIATNSDTMKERNKRLILNFIRKNEYSRSMLAEKISLTKAAVSIIVDDLIAIGAIYESKAIKTEVGRRPRRLKLNPDFMYAVGINITRRYVEIGLVNIGGKVICEKKFDLLPKRETFQKIVLLINSMIAENNISHNNIYGIGVTAPGPVDAVGTTILNPTNFDEWHYENIGLRLKNVLERKVYLENISGGIALCENYFGCAKEVDDFLLLIVSDGIGSGIVSAGKLMRNPTELGHTSIAFDGLRCKCGNAGCLEQYASIPSILQGTEYQTWVDVVDADDVAVIEQEAKYLACSIVNAVNLFSFDKVILEGEINYKPQKLIAAIKRIVRNNTISRNIPFICSGSAFHGVVCAAVTVFDNYFNIS